MLFAVNATAEIKSGKCGADITWNYNEDNFTLTLTGSGAMTNFTDKNGAPWRTTTAKFGGRDFFISTLVENVIIEGNITNIGDYAFDECNYLRTLNVQNPDLISSIGTRAFNNCSALKIEQTFENATIGDYAFAGCTSMKDEYGVIYLGKYLVEANTNCVKNVVIKSGTTAILSGAFIGTGVETIQFRDETLTSIGDKAFYGCSNLTTLDIPNTVTTWGKDIFYNCISLPNDETETFKKAGDHVIVKVSKTGEKQYRIPSNIIYIADSAFYACNQVTKIVSEHPTTIPQAARTAFTFTQIETPNIYVADGKESECANKWGIAATKINHTTIPVGSTGYATVSLEHSAQVPSGVKAYTVYVEDGQIKLKEVSKLAKHAGYMLYGDVKNHTFKPLGNRHYETEYNDLVGLQEDKELRGTGIYLLTSRNGDVKFRCLDKTSKVLTAGKAYLSVPNATASEYSVRIISDDDTETDIDETLENNAHANNRTIYNIAGQRVNQPRQGLNIIDGKLVIM